MGTERGKLRLIARKIGEPAFTLLDRGAIESAHTIDPMGKKEAAAGVHHPPLAVYLLRPEKTGGFQLRAQSSSTVLVPIFWPRLRGNVFCFQFAPSLQVRNRFDLSRPVPVLVLSECVDAREKRIGIRHPSGGRLVDSGGANPWSSNWCTALGFPTKTSNCVMSPGSIVPGPL